MATDSDLYTKRSMKLGAYRHEPRLSEHKLTTWFTMGEWHIPQDPEGADQDLAAPYHAALLDEFFLTLPARIVFWENVRAAACERILAKFGDESAPTTDELGVYIERLRWVAGPASDRSMLRLDAVQHFRLVAIALQFGIGFAVRWTWADADDPILDDRQTVGDAANTLEILIHQQRGTAVQFTPGSTSGDPLHPTPWPGWEPQASAPTVGRHGE
jgi:hypothetical protein